MKRIPILKFINKKTKTKVWDHILIYFEFIRKINIILNTLTENTFKIVNLLN